MVKPTHEVFKQCWFNVGPPSTTLVQHWSSIGWIPCDCCELGSTCSRTGADWVHYWTYMYAWDVYISPNVSPSQRCRMHIFSFSFMMSWGLLPFCRITMTIIKSDTISANCRLWVIVVLTSKQDTLKFSCLLGCDHGKQCLDRELPFDFQGWRGGVFDNIFLTNSYLNLTVKKYMVWLWNFTEIVTLGSYEIIS